jgi:hypothetical protein
MYRLVPQHLVGSRHRLTQKLNQQLLRCEIDAIGEIITDSKISPISADDAPMMVAQRATEKARRMMGIGKNGRVRQDKIRKYHLDDSPTVLHDDLESHSESSQLSNRVKDRLDHFESMKGTPRYQDLTHPEARRVQELFERKKMLARKVQWLKNNQIIDPVRIVSKEMKAEERAERKQQSRHLFPLPKEDVKDPLMEKRIRQIEFKMIRDTAISRVRTELRKQKLEKSAVMNMTTPDIGSITTDPLKRHLNRRRVRVALLMQQYLDELLTSNSAQIIIDHLGGAAISVERVSAPSTRGVHNVFVRVSSPHDPKWVAEKLDILTPKIRSQLAVRVNYGYTPELKFIVLDDVSKFQKSRLLTLADEAKRQVDMSLHQHFMKEMNWK